MIWIRPNGKLPWLLQCYFWYEKFMPREAAYMVKNWSFISALLSGNQSQFNFETLTATETNYEQQDLKALIKMGVNKVTQRYHWGNTGRRRGLSTGGFSFPGNSAKQGRETYLEGQWETLSWVWRLQFLAEGAGQAFSLCYEDATNWGWGKNSERKGGCFY